MPNKYKNLQSLTLSPRNESERSWDEFNWKAKLGRMMSGEERQGVDPELLPLGSTLAGAAADIAGSYLGEEAGSGNRAAQNLAMVVLGAPLARIPLGLTEMFKRVPGAGIEEELIRNWEPGGRGYFRQVYKSPPSIGEGVVAKVQHSDAWDTGIDQQLLEFMGFPKAQRDIDKVFLSQGVEEQALRRGVDPALLYASRPLVPTPLALTLPDEGWRGTPNPGIKVASPSVLFTDTLPVARGDPSLSSHEALALASQISLTDPALKKWFDSDVAPYRGGVYGHNFYLTGKPPAYPYRQFAYDLGLSDVERGEDELSLLASLSETSPFVATTAISPSLQEVVAQRAAGYRSDPFHLAQALTSKKLSTPTGKYRLMPDAARDVDEFTSSYRITPEDFRRIIFQNTMRTPEELEQLVPVVGRAVRRHATR